ncbi:NAD(P)/FAD-dependent oxidoreductase [Methylophilus sp. DW102]|uniref:NAD(P)/FAD-dependent oxidoreductase n=1 Tax=Methylophilus sp. DW102 TaxID=3095607 RepID=UPI0030898169|nr:NAD(P)/FAD-dependent oxidoreductase [Methylophilus sp. DW102]
MPNTNSKEVIIIGAGFSGLAAAYELTKRGIAVTVLEASNDIGGLASAFEVGGERLDKFYHHWFTNDLEVMSLISELGLADNVKINPTNTGVYYANNFFKLSTPRDLLNFTPLAFLDRIRLGLLALKARRIKNWKVLESKTAEEWLRELGGEQVYKVIWQPLLKGKFGPYAEKVSAVWFWNKLKLRGGSRGKGGEERLAYLKGSFALLAETLAKRIVEYGGRIELNSPVNRFQPHDGRWEVVTNSTSFHCDRVIATPALPLIADMISSWATPAYVASLNRIEYIGNVCLVLELTQPLSKTYWLNVNDPDFPFVGVIEHTNFEKPETYDGRHIVYLSKYLPHTDPLYSMNADQFMEYALPYLKRMFPAFNTDWILKHYLWRARWSQPVVEKNYSQLIPSEDAYEEGMHICSMAQIYPEDRGTNYAIREGRKVGMRIANLLQELI